MGHDTRGTAGGANAARAVGLRYACDDQAGIRREMGPLGFRYRDANGRLIRSAAELKRIRALVIPPAWTDVWICRDPRGHLQATGRDQRGRKQYRYHPAWRASRDESKFDRMTAFAAVLPKIRARTSADLSRPGLSREKVIATVVQLLEKSLIRVGNEEYAKANRSFGLTTLHDRHVDVKGAAVRFQFRGKSGVKHAVDVNDPRLARIVKQCRDLPGQQLFQYVDDTGAVQDIASSDVNQYLREVTGEEFTAKDFRTWAGTVLALTALRDADAVSSLADARRKLLKAIDAVAGVLGNTRAVCRKSYIHPAVLDAFISGPLPPPKGKGRACRRRAPSGLRPEEEELLALLRDVSGRDKRAAA